MAGTTAGEEWRANWGMVLSAMVGMSFYASINYAFGQFIQPLEAEFHWSRAAISVGLAIFNFTAVLFGPLMGFVIDRYGSRRVGIPGIVLASCAYAALSLTNASLARWYLLWAVFAVCGLTIKSTIWSLAITRAFTASRGLALSLMLCGSAVAQALAQLIPNALILRHGWRVAYLAIGFGWGGLAAVLLFLFFHERRAGPVGTPALAAGPALPGLTLREALGDSRILRLALVNLLASLVGGGITVHMMPLLTQTGLDRTSAAEIAATAGLAGIVGKLLTGWLLDKVQGNLVPFSSYALSTVGYLLLLNWFHAPWALTAGVMVLGYTAGAGLQVSTYLVGRYGGLRNFGTIFATIGSMMYIGSALGPVIAGVVHDRTGSYDALLLTAAPVALVVALLLIGLGPYPRFESEAPPEEFA